MEPTTVQVLMLGIGGLVAAIGVLWQAYHRALQDARVRELELLRKGSDDKRGYMARLEEHGELMRAVQQNLRAQRELVKTGFRAMDARMTAIVDLIGEGPR